MAWQVAPAAIPFVGAAIASLAAAYHSCRSFRIPGARLASILMLLCAASLMAQALQVSSALVLTKALLADVAFSAIVPVPAVFLAFAVAYTGRRRWLTRPARVLLCIEPALVLGLVWISDRDGLIWTRHAFDPSLSIGGLSSTPGPVHWAHGIYSYALLLVATLLLVRILVQARHMFGWLVAPLLFATVSPWLAAASHIAGFGPFPLMQATFLASCVAALGLAYGLFRLRQGDVVSVSRRVVMETMGDGLLLLDSANRIVDLNPAAEAIIGESASSAIGQPIVQLWPEWADGLTRLHSTDHVQQVGREVTLGKGERRRTYDVRISPLADWHGCLVSRVVVVRDITIRKLLEQELAERYEGASFLAERDSLTGLLNHGAIYRRLEEELSRARRYGRRLSLLILDLDDFKLFNDTYGHPAADRVLQQVSKLMWQFKRESDVLGRYGGDEFVAILPETDGEGALALAERLCSAMANHPYIAPDGLAVPVRMSFGIATYPDDASDVQQLVAKADANLYESKQQDSDGVEARLTLLREGLVRAGSFGVLEGLVTTVHRKDRYTRRHSEDVTNYAIALARALGLSREAQRTLRIAGLLHDVGKIAVPDRILRKPGILDEEEYAIVKQHAAFGELIIKDVPNLRDVLDAVASHHERIDGAGYPHGLKGEEIPLLARILAVADTYSAITSDRPYRAAKNSKEARAELLRVAGTQLDPELVRVFLNVCLARESSHTSAELLTDHQFGSAKRDQHRRLTG